MLASALGSCGTADPAYGPPGSILGRALPNETSGGGGDGGSSGGVFGAPYDPSANAASIRMVTAHTGTAGPTQPGDAIDCLSCHGATGAAKNKPMTFGGRVVRSAQGAANVDVIVVRGGDRFGPVKSDQDGFFWLFGDALPAGAKAHVRSGTGSESMSSPLGAGAGGSCDSASCHVPGKHGKIQQP